MGLAGLLANTADGVCAINEVGKIVLWNRAAEKILGYSARDVDGTFCCDLFGGRDAAGNRLCYRGCHVTTQVRRGELVRHFDMMTRTKAGRPARLNISVVVVRGARPGRWTTVYLFREVTMSREIEALVRERLAQAEPRPASGNGFPAALTRREIEILGLLAGGANTRVMAERLHVSPATVRNHVQHIFGKLDLHSRLEVVAYASRHGLLRSTSPPRWPRASARRPS